MDDVLANKLIPPLTLREFEDYIIFHERAAENLYFVFWLRRYTQKYQTGPSDPSLPNEFRKGLNNFIFAPHDSPLVLNLPDSLKISLEKQLHPNACDPKLLEDIRHQVRDYLRESLVPFARASSGNADLRRSMFAMVLGVSTIFLGLIPFIVALVLRASRLWRLISIPVIYLGIVLLVGGYGRTCLLIYLFAPASRQLRSWELERERPPISPSFSQYSTHKIHLESDRGDMEKTPSESDAEQIPHKAESLSSGAASSVPSLWYFPEPSPNLDSSSTLSFPTLLPACCAPASSAPIFGPLTRVFDPRIVRTQKRLMLTSFTYALIITGLLSAIIMSVPNPK